MDLDKKTSTRTHRGASGEDATTTTSQLEGLLRATDLSRPRRLGGLRLVLAVASLCTVLWVLAGTFVWQAPNSTGSADQVLLATPNLRSNVTAAESKQCETIDRGHVEKAFYHPESCFSRNDIRHIILGLVWTLTDVFKSNDIPYWLDSGTLLGSDREKTVIPYDVDADIGISEASYFQLRDNQYEFPSEYELQVLGGKFHHQGTRDDALPARFIHKASGLYLDIFVFLDNKKDPTKFGALPSVCFAGCYRCPKQSGWKKGFAISKDWVYPLQACPFGGRNVTCPAKSELYLDHLYGPNFMTPDKNTS